MIISMHVVEHSCVELFSLFLFRGETREQRIAIERNMLLLDSQFLKTSRYLSLLALACLIFSLLSIRVVLSVHCGTSRLVYEWTTLEFDWPSISMKQAYIQNGSYVPERNLVAGIKVYKNDVYLTIPRWRWNAGQPATLVKVVTVNGQHKLRPFPDWASQNLGDCNALQYVQSMEIDPNTGRMYVIDTGRTGLAGSPTPRNICPPKIVVYDLNTSLKLFVHELPDSVVSHSANFMNDLVLDYVNNQVRFAYITDVYEGKLYVFDFLKRSSYYLEDQSMKPEGNNNTVIHIRNKEYTFEAGIDGIAMAWDFEYVYYTPLGGYDLYQIPTHSLRRMTGNIDGATKTEMGIRRVGKKISQTDGMLHGRNSLYFGVLAWNAVYQWNITRDMAFEMLPIDQVSLYSQDRLARHDGTMQWVDTFAMDEDGWLWFVSNRLHLFASGTMDFTGADGANVRVWKVFVNDTGYLQGANRRTGLQQPGDSVVG